MPQKEMISLAQRVSPVHKRQTMKLSEVLETLEQMDEKTKGSLGKWFREKWVDISRTNKDGSHPPCGASAGKKKSAAKQKRDEAFKEKKKLEKMSK